MRIVKPRFFTDEEIADLAPLTRLLFIGLWTIADRKGRLEDRPKRIKAEIMPYDNHNIDTALTHLHDAGFITRYEVDRKKYIQINTFEKHQHCHIKESESTIPAPCKTGASTPLSLTVTGTVTDTVTGTSTDPLSGKPDFEGVISYLNQKINQNYRATGKGTKKLILARWNEGFNLDDFKKAIDNMTGKWLTDPKMSQYLRPVTLFGEKFESYLNAKVTLSDKGIVSQKTEKSIAVGQQWLKKHQGQEEQGDA